MCSRHNLQLDSRPEKQHFFRIDSACERQTYFLSSLLSFGGREATTGNTSAVRRLVLTLHFGKVKVLCSSDKLSEAICRCICGDD